MRTIDIRRVAVDASTTIGLSDREMVASSLAEDARVNHIERERVVGGVRYVTVEMASGEWLTVPADAIIIA